MVQWFPKCVLHGPKGLSVEQSRCTDVQQYNMCENTEKFLQPNEINLGTIKLKTCKMH